MSRSSEPRTLFWHLHLREELLLCQLEIAKVGLTTQLEDNNCHVTHYFDYLRYAANKGVSISLFAIVNSFTSGLIGLE